MKYFILFVVFGVFGTLNYFSPRGKVLLVPQMQSEKKTSDSTLPSAVNDTGIVTATQATPKIMQQPLGVQQTPVRYTIAARFNDTTLTLSINQTTVWHNVTPFSTSEIYFHFYQNAFKNKSLFLGSAELPAKYLTNLQISSWRINGIETPCQYVNTDAVYPTDSTVCRAVLPEPVQKGDSVVLDCSYSYQVPKAYGRMGYSPDKDYFLFSQWYIKPGVFENGKWICSPYFPWAEFYADFADFQVTVTAPSYYTIEGSSQKSSVKIANNKFRIHEFNASNVHDFAWNATKQFPVERFQLRSKNGKDVAFSIIYPPAYGDLLERYKATLKSAFLFFETSIGAFPYKTFTLSITPQNSGRIGSMEYPGFATIQHSPLLFSSSLEIEKLIVHEFAHQYFYGAVANNETYEGWLDEGLASYLTSSLLDVNGLGDISSFKLFGQFPVQGLEILAMDEIPLIYTLTKIKIPNQAAAMRTYYHHANEAALSDSSYLLDSPSLYHAITYGKSELFFKTLERLAGRQKFLKILSKFYSVYKFRHVSAQEFFAFMQANLSRDMSWYIKNYFDESFICDYAVKNIAFIANNKECRVDIRRNGEAFFPCEVSLITQTDTITRTISNPRRFFSVYLKCEKEPVGVEIDLHRKNFFDVNLANNSKMITKQYAATTYFSMRWFFWIQNLLLIFGSLA